MLWSAQFIDQTSESLFSSTSRPRVLSTTFPPPAVNFINIYAHVFRTKFWCQSQNVTRKAAKKDVCTKKAREKTLMKLTPALFLLTTPPPVTIFANVCCAQPRLSNPKIFYFVGSVQTIKVCRDNILRIYRASTCKLLPSVKSLRSSIFSPSKFSVRGSVSSHSQLFFF